MPQFLDKEAIVPSPVRTIPSGKPLMLCSTGDEVIKNLTENGFACLKMDFTASWKELEAMMNKLDQETIDKVNSFYNEKKIIKSPKLTDKENIDRKVAFDLSADRVAALGQSGLMERFPELQLMISYFSHTKAWLTHLTAGLGEVCGQDKFKFNFRMIDYKEDFGTCQPHRDFGLVTLVQQNGVSGLKVELAGEMVDVPEDCSLLLAGWCLHLTSNGKVPAPLHQVTSPRVRRLSCVTFLAPEPGQVLDPVLAEGATPLYRTVTAGELKTMMAKRWRVREGTLPAGDDHQTSQDDFVFNNLKI